jgi:hypothetical protein
MVGRSRNAGGFGRIYSRKTSRNCGMGKARDQREVKTAGYLYPWILVRPDGDLVFTSEYAGIAKEFSSSQLEEVFASLPGSVWVDGKSVGITQIGAFASEADSQTMSQITEKVKAFFSSKGYRVYGLPI